MDNRLTSALHDLGFHHPTLVQSRALPLAFAGKDVLARARTGTGKTLVYSAPILQRVLELKLASGGTRRTESEKAGILAVVLLPTRELGMQIFDHFMSLMKYCSKDVRAVFVSGEDSKLVQQSKLQDSPDIVISTPSVLADHLVRGTVTLAESLVQLAIDEADFILDFGYEKDLKSVLSFCPSSYQGFLLSATLTNEVQTLSRLVLHNPRMVSLKDAEVPNSMKIVHYVVRAADFEKFLNLYLLLKLRLVEGRILVFVNSIPRSYKLKLFLNNFSISCAVLNSELPHNTRYHILQEFNRGVFDILIATDESTSLRVNSVSLSKLDNEELTPVKEENDEDEEMEEDENLEDDEADEEMDELSESDEDEEEDDEEDEEDDEEDDDEEEEEEEEEKKGIHKNNSKQSKEVKVKVEKETPVSRRGVNDRSEGDEEFSHNANSGEYGVSRGLDFQNVSAVINFDFPLTLGQYIHRVGRTGRAGRTGTALSFATWEEDSLLEATQEYVEAELQTKLTPFSLKKELVENFRYRVDDVYRSITDSAVREARLKEIQRELLNSAKLQTYLEEHPQDAEVLSHAGGVSSRKRENAHLKHVPDYLLRIKEKTEAIVPGGSEAPKKPTVRDFFTASRSNQTRMDQSLVPNKLRKRRLTRDEKSRLRKFGASAMRDETAGNQSLRFRNVILDPLRNADRVTGTAGDKEPTRLSKRMARVLTSGQGGVIKKRKRRFSTH